MKGKTIFLCSLLLLILTVAAAAETLDTLDYSFAEEVTFSDLGLERKTILPVYGAPLENAWRGSQGKAAVSVSEPFLLLGAAQEGEWLLVDYDVNTDSRRIGWIRRPEEYDAGDAPWLELSRELYRVKKDCTLTDDPGKSQRAIRTLQTGESVIAMLQMQEAGKNWLYAETEQNGQPVWGFVDAECLEAEPAWRVEGDLLLIREGVNRMGLDPGMYGEEDDTTSLIRMGDIWCPELFLEDMIPSDIRRIVLPSTLRMMGPEALCQLTGQDIVLSGHLDFASDYAFDGGWIRQIVLGRDFSGAVPGFYHCGLCAWSVQEENTAYLSRDGVLFSGDGKTLIAYPPGKSALHYDVPAGTETIAAGAFNDGSMGIPLQTVSLPVGLRRIGAYAFGGCGRLHSLTVPLTVTELDENAFANCVSLERLSLPPGMTASWGDDYALHEDLSHYMGDNGCTLTEPREENAFGEVITETRVTVPVWLSGENGEGPVPVYDSATAETAVREKPSGTRVTYSSYTGHRARIWDGGHKSWVDLDCTVPAGVYPFFMVSSVVPTAEGMEELKRQHMEGYDEVYFDDEGEMVGRFYRKTGEAGEEDDTAELPFRQLVLYRPYTGDSRTFAMLVTDEPGKPIHLLDAPEGASAGWTYRPEQAEVLESRDGWFRVRTIALTGWVQAENLLIVEQEPSGNETVP